MNVATQNNTQKSYSIVIPAYNEALGIGHVLEEILALKINRLFEIIVVDDSSTDETAEITKKFPIVLIHNIQNSGYGYSLKQGVRNAKYENIIITDADGTYPVASIPELIEAYESGFDMIVGARQGKFYHGTIIKRIARFFFKKLSEFTAGRRIPDINSGLRVFRKDLAFKFFNTLSNGFSFTTTITLAFMLNSYNVKYIPIPYSKRSGSSKVRYLHDTLRSSQIIIEAIIFYNPLKLFLLLIIFQVITGVLSLVIGYLFSIWLAMTIFLTVSVSLLLFGIGSTVVFLSSSKKNEKT